MVWIPAVVLRTAAGVAVGAACVDPSLPALMRSEERPAGRGGKGF